MEVSQTEESIDKANLARIEKEKQEAAAREAQRKKEAAERATREKEEKANAIVNLRTEEDDDFNY